jgi:hypothetical protein
MEWPGDPGRSDPPDRFGPTESLRLSTDVDALTIQTKWAAEIFADVPS